MAELRLYTTESGRMAPDSYTLNGLLETIQGQGMVWLDISQPDEEVKEFLSSEMEFDELAVDDVFGHADTASLRFEDHRFIVVTARDGDHRLDTAPVAVFVKNDMLITVRHTEIPALTTFARRFLTSDDEDLALGIDYMLYELLDAIADDWSPIFSQISSDLDHLEFRVFDPSQRYDDLLEGLHDLKRKLREANKSVESLHAVTMRLLKPSERLISESVERYINDLHQLSIAFIKRVNNYSSGATSTRDTYLSNISLQLSESNAKLTEVMTTLTIIGAIMLPLTLIAGIFGMNNDDLPIDRVGGFWGIIFIMVVFAVIMLTYFWRRGWLNNLR